MSWLVTAETEKKLTGGFGCSFLLECEMAQHCHAVTFKGVFLCENKSL